MLYFGLDITYWLIMIPFFLFALWAQSRVKAAYKKYSRIAIYNGLSGAQTAQQILLNNRITDVRIERGSGLLSDHYNPSKKVIRLSPGVYDSNSVAAVSIAAHETGHAIQHAKAYSPLALRSMLAPTASIGSNFAFIIIFAGLLINMAGLIKFGIALFAIVVFFQLVTLPVEFDASARAKKALVSYSMVNNTELKGVNTVLNAAAMTYVAAAASAIAQLLYLLLRSGFLGDD
ncbi:MAG: zinc metallopeptidase [Spirochaetes bacterium]|nr:zinc metallopeptidase [Spirochaetota bacterium]MBN2769945.1 zinc metallopeptidase [Spirochaetota bacterium]